MTQARLNHLIIIDLKLVGNDFIIAKDTRRSVFAKF